MEEIIHTEIAILGGGSAGYVAAIRAAQLKANSVILIEKGQVGGTCLNRGCIPTKVLIESAKRCKALREMSRFGLKSEYLGVDFFRIQKRKNMIVRRLVKGIKFLLKNADVRVLNGEGRFIDPHTISVTAFNRKFRVSAEKVVIATGSKPFFVPIPGIDGVKVLSSKELLELDQIPKSLIVIGGGAIGGEFACAFRCFEESDVTIVEMLPRLIPMEDSDLSKELEAAFKRTGIKVHTGSRVTRISDTPIGKKRVTFTDSENNESNIEADYVLVSIGRAPAISGLNLDLIGVKHDRGIIVNNKMETNIPGVYAAGDVVQGVPSPMLAYTASHEGEVAVENALGHEEAEMNYHAIPSTIFTNPEISSVGLTEEKAKDKYSEILVGKFPFQGNGRAIIAGANRGFVKVILDAKTTEIIGVHIIGPNATELIAEGALAVANRMKAKDLVKVEHAHPVFYETIKEATLDALGSAIHK
ncbi:MAG: dihydrolipoyl dehydrogenase [Candidatus Hodarchaeales archaeon]|jgi:dihydrolipoamide dehydrogenase